MNLYPAIDIKNGACVRLLYGDFEKVTTYNEDPGAQAEEFVAAGCRWIHVVDLDGAVEGGAVNRDAVAAILNAGLPVQLGGGIRDMAGVEHWITQGISRVILGTAALKNPQLVKEAAREFPGKIAVGADARGGMIAAVPKITRLMPWLIQCSTPAISRIPPPNCTGKPAFKIDATASRLTAWPSTAPSKSTT